MEVSNRKCQLRGVLVAVSCVLGLGGCSGGGNTLPTAPVKGVVTYRGEPVNVGKIVFFHPTGQAASGELNGEGEFQLEAFQGSNEIAVVSYGPDRPNPIKNGFPPTVPGESLVPRHYTESRTSGLIFEVKDGDNVAELKLQD